MTTANHSLATEAESSRVRLGCMMVRGLPIIPDEGCLRDMSSCSRSCTGKQRILGSALRTLDFSVNDSSRYLVIHGGIGT